MTFSTEQKTDRSGWLSRNWPVVIFLLVLATYLYLAIKLAHGLDFNDETEKLLAAEMMDKGRRLYSHIFVQHGPFAYMLSHIFYEMFHARSLAVSRAIPITMALLSALAVMLSPALATRKARLVAGAILLAGYVFTQAIYAEVMTMYQIYAAYLFIIALAVFLVPFIMGAAVKRAHAAIAGMCLAFIFFCGFSFAISIFFCGLLCLAKYAFDKERRRQNGIMILFFVLGGVLGSALVLGWLAMFGSIEGYIVDHFYFNLYAYKHYLVMSPYKTLRLMVPGWSWKSAPDKATWYTHFAFALVPVYSAFLVWAMARRKTLGRIYQYPVLYALLVIAVIYMNPRFELHIFASTLVMVTIGLVALVTAIIIDRSAGPALARLNIAGLILFVIASIVAQYTLVTYVYSLSPIKYYRHHDAPLGRMDSADMKFLRGIVGEDEPVQQFPFNLNFYVRADRLPAFDAFYWMPWQADNARHPIKPGYAFDLCQDMKEAPPKAVFYVEDPIWGHSPDSFMGCIKDTLKQKYLRTGRMANLWLRADVVADRDEALQAAIVPMDYDATWLGPEKVARIDAMKRDYKALASGDGKTCLQTPLAPHDRLRAGSCSSPDVLAFALRERPAGTEILTLPDDECVDLDLDAKDAIKPYRLWPCTGSPVQAFTVLPQGDGGMRLQDRQTKNCIIASGTNVVEGDCGTAPVWKFSDLPHVTEPVVNYSVLMSMDTTACLLNPGKEESPIAVGSCSDPNVLKIDPYTSAEGTRILTLPDNDCIDVGDSGKADAPVYLEKYWDRNSQVFAMIPYQDGYVLKSHETGLCLTVDGKALHQTDCAKATQWR